MGARICLILLLSLAAAAEPVHLNLEQARRRALEVSPTLRRYQARIEEANFKVDEAEVPGRPRLDLTARYTRVTPPLSFSFPGLGTPLSVIVTDNFSASIGLQQTLASFGRLHWSTLAAQLAEESAREELRREREAAWHRTAVAYGRYLFAREAEQVAQGRVAARTAHQHDEDLLFQAGKAAHYDVLVSQTALAEDLQRLEQAQQQSRLSRTQLLVLLEQPDGTEFDLEPLAAPESPSQSLPQGLEQAYGQRPELCALNMAADSARAKASFEESQSNPSLDFQTRYEQRTGTDFLPNRAWTVGLVFAVPLYDGGLSEARAGQAQAVVKQLEESREEVRRQVRLEVEQAHLSLQTSWRLIEVARTRKVQAEEAARLADLRFRSGLGTQTEVLDAQTRLGEAGLALAEATETYREAGWEWERVTSSGCDRR